MIKILMVHNYYQRQSPSGENASFEAEVNLLRDFGHRVVVFTRDNEEITQYTPFRRLGLFTECIWSFTTQRTLQRLLQKDRPDVVHFQNTFPLISPAGYYLARSCGLPVIQTLRNYRLLCPNAVFFRDGHVCEDCLGKLVPWPGVFHRCYRSSRAATSVVATMLIVHRLLRTWQRMVDIYIALTEFARQKFIQGGLPAEKIMVKPNFVYPDPNPGSHSGAFALFVGRLSPEKGLRTVLAAWKHLGNTIPLRIVGDGPLSSEVAKAATGTPALEWLGRKGASEVYTLMGEARVVLFPSEWYETFGRVIIEAYAKGTPVIAANIGAASELVEHGRTGLLFRPGDPEDLADKVAWAWSHPHALAEMGRAARHEYETKYTAERNYEQLMAIYDMAIAQARACR